MIGFNNQEKIIYDATSSCDITQTSICNNPDYLTIDNSDHTLYKEELICLTPVKRFEKPKKIFTKPHHIKKKKGYEY